MEAAERPLITLDDDSTLRNEEPTPQPEPLTDITTQEELDTALALAVHEAEVEALHYDNNIPHENIQVIISDATYGRLVPKINQETYFNPTLAGRQRLDLRLDMYALAERQVHGDGNCQFSSLSDQLYNTPALYGFVREKVVWQLKEHPERYQAYVPGSYNKYVKSMAKSRTWGDHVTLQAASDFFRLRICLLTSFEDTTVIEVEPLDGAPGCRTLWLSFWAEIHYNSIHARGDPPPEAPQILVSNNKKLLGSEWLHKVFRGG